MAQKSAEPGKDARVDPEIVPGTGLSVPEISVSDTTIDLDADDLEPMSGAAHAIDNLLALTGESWDVDDQVRTLKMAAAVDSRPKIPALPPSKPKLSSVPMPTAYDMGAKSGPALPMAPGSSPAPPPVAVPSRPPPLPPQASRGSKGPPPLPIGEAKRPSTGTPPVRPPVPSKGPPPLPGSASVRPPPPPSKSKADGDSPSLLDLLAARVSSLEATDDRVGLARSHMELALVCEILGDEARAANHAEAALRVDPALGTAHSMLRRRKHSRAAIGAMLTHLEHELSAATTEAAAVELMVERARLLDASGSDSVRVRAAWEQVLTRAPQHAAALKGLEAELWDSVRRESHAGAGVTAQPSTSEACDALATHLGRMADAYSSEPRLASWLHVERAHLLERRLGRVDAARAALERAVRLDPSVGPVRNAYVNHLAAQSDMGALIAALEQEASIETSSSRSARLELEAAVIAHDRLRDDVKAIALLERASMRAPTTPSVDQRVLEELVRLYEGAAMWPEALRTRRAYSRFITEPAHLAHELRTMAVIAERLGDVDAAIADIQRAMTVDGRDPTLIEMLDRLLGSAGKDEQRLTLWLTEAARTEDGATRAKALNRAAVISDGALQRPVEAVRHLRAAWVASPGDPETLDMLSRLLSPAPSQRVDGDVRALIELYVQAVQTAHDRGRKVAYLERIALLWEELIGDANRAARAFEDILELEPDRRTAVLGLARTAARIGDERALARALLDEARLADSGADVHALRVRAATALARHDPARALSIAQEVLAVAPRNAAARALEIRLHEDAGRWEAAAKSMHARIENTEPKDTFALWLGLAIVQDLRLRAPLDALASLEKARATDPTHPIPPLEIARILEAAGDDQALRRALEKLALDMPTGEARARFLVRAAEIAEHRLSDDEQATNLYGRALAEMPDDEMIADRLSRVLARRGAVRPNLASHAGGDAAPAIYHRVTPAGIGERAAHLTARYKRAATPLEAQSLGFEYASLLVELGQDLPHATGLLESILDANPSHVAALRTLESLARKTSAWTPLARALSKQGDAFVDVRARLGALSCLAALEEWKLPAPSAQAAQPEKPPTTYARILGLDPTDAGALEATVRRELVAASRGDLRAKHAVISALRALSALSSDQGSQLAQELRIALLLESASTDPAEANASALTREALDRYRTALSIDPLSITAATGLARMSNRLGDVHGAVTAAMSLAELSTQPKPKARYLLDAAELLLGDEHDDRLGSTAERRDRAGNLLEDALACEPDSLIAAGRLVSIRIEQGRAEALVETFRDAIEHAKSTDAVIFLGSEIARVARDELGDLTLAIDAMRRVRQAAPSHVPSLLTLGELCIAQRAWPEAVDALESVGTATRETGPRLAALFALAGVYDNVLNRADEAERVLRQVLSIDPSNTRALRALIHRIASAQTGPSATGGSDERKREIASLLDKLAQAEPDYGQKTTILLELADVHLGLGDRSAAERALIDAITFSPDDAKAFARLGAFHRTPAPQRTASGAGGRDVVSYARALTQLITRGGKLGTVDGRWLAALGQLEIDGMGRIRDGIAHLQQAVQMDPSLYEVRLEIARAYARLGANEEATRAVMAMIVPNPAPLLSVSEPSQALELLESTLGAERRPEEALVVSELRALAGGLDEGRHEWLRARRLAPLDPHHQGLDRPTLVAHVLPPEGRHVMLEIAAAIAGIESKVLRADIGELGISARDRVGPRSGHPMRALLDRLARALGISSAEVDLVITPAVTRTRVLAQDSLWIVVPRALAELPEPVQLASVARALARISLGVPWLEEIPAPHVEALLVASARQVVPTYGEGRIDGAASKLLPQYEGSVAKALPRKKRRILEELAPHLEAPQGRPMPIDAFISALARAEVRTAYILTGDLLAIVDELRRRDAGLLHATDTHGRPALQAVLEHPLAGDIIRYALTNEATALRKRVGATWTG